MFSEVFFDWYFNDIGFKMKDHNKFILIIHQSAEMYGSDRVLFNLAIGVAKSNQFVPIVVVPEMGLLVVKLRTHGIEVHIANIGKISRATFGIGGVCKLMTSLYRVEDIFFKLLNGRKVVLVHSNTLAVVGGAYWAWRNKIPHIWHVHEIIVKPQFLSLLFPVLVDALSVGVISPSSSTENWISRWKRRIESKFKVIANGVEPPTDLQRASNADLLNIDDGVVVTLAGRVNRWKGHNLLIDAILLLRSRGQLGDMRFVFVGGVFKGQEYFREDLIKRIDEHDLNGLVKIIDFVDNIYCVWNFSDVAVVPSTDPEPFGMVAIEAMAARLPVVAANHGGLADIVVDGVTGLLFEPGNASALADALAKLSSNKELRENFGAAGRSRQQSNFSIEVQIDKTLDFYRETLLK